MKSDFISKTPSDALRNAAPQSPLLLSEREAFHAADICRALNLIRHFNLKSRNK